MLPTLILEVVKEAVNPTLECINPATISNPIIYEDVPIPAQFLLYCRKPLESPTGHIYSAIGVYRKR